jgi:hypothetical protein
MYFSQWRREVGPINFSLRKKNQASLNIFLPKEKTITRLFEILWLFCINIWEENKNSIGEGKSGGDLILPFHEEKENQVVA